MKKLIKKIRELITQRQYIVVAVDYKEHEHDIYLFRSERSAREKYQKCIGEFRDSTTNALNEQNIYCDVNYWCYDDDFVVYYYLN